jgi:DNA-binding GntR family transcriptional regulator
MKKGIVKYKSLKNLAHDYFRNNIVDGVLKPGDLIEEKNLSSRLNISRTPVREALLLLKTEGFVAILPEDACLLTNVN